MHLRAVCRSGYVSNLGDCLLGRHRGGGPSSRPVNPAPTPPAARGGHSRFGVGGIPASERSDGARDGNGTRGCGSRLGSPRLGGIRRDGRPDRRRSGGPSRDDHPVPGGTSADYLARTGSDSRRGTGCGARHRLADGRARDDQPRDSEAVTEKDVESAAKSRVDGRRFEVTAERTADEARYQPGPEGPVSSGRWGSLKDRWSLTGATLTERDSSETTANVEPQAPWLNPHSGPMFISAGVGPRLDVRRINVRWTPRSAPTPLVRVAPSHRAFAGRFPARLLRIQAPRKHRRCIGGGGAGRANEIRCIPSHVGPAPHRPAARVVLWRKPSQVAPGRLRETCSRRCPTCTLAPRQRGHPAVQLRRRSRTHPGRPGSDRCIGPSGRSLARYTGRRCQSP